MEELVKLVKEKKEDYEKVQDILKEEACKKVNEIIGMLADVNITILSDYPDEIIDGFYINNDGDIEISTRDTYN